MSRLSMCRSSPMTLGTKRAMQALSWTVALQSRSMHPLAAMPVVMEGTVLSSTSRTRLWMMEGQAAARASQVWIILYQCVTLIPWGNSSIWDRTRNTRICLASIRNQCARAITDRILTISVRWSLQIQIKMLHFKRLLRFSSPAHKSRRKSSISGSVIWNSTRSCQVNLIMWISSRIPGEMGFLSPSWSHIWFHRTV